MAKFKSAVKAAHMFFEQNMSSCWYIVSALAIAVAVMGGDKLSLVYSGIAYLIARSYDK